MQKGFAPIIIILGVIILAGVFLLLPLPFYQSSDTLCLPMPPGTQQNCPQKGWHLGLPVWKQVVGRYFALHQEKDIITILVPPSPTPTPKAVETANWKIFTDPNNRFSIKYPEEWDVWSSSQEVQILEKSVNLDFSIRVEALLKDPQDFINDEIEINKNTSGVYIEEHSKLNIGELDTLQIKHTTDSQNQVELFAFLGSKQVSVTFLYVNPERLRLISLSLSTFKFN